MTDGLHEHDRPADLALARVHLRLGSLALARAELETLAGRDELDPEGLVDLAEARWRTGDLDGAGEAAVAALHDEDGPLLALIVAAEAAAARGRPSEARRLAERALAASGGAIDPLFAGMPRAPIWPPDAAAPPPAPTTLFGPPHGPGTTPAAAGPRDADRAGPTDPDDADVADGPGGGSPGDRADAGTSATIALWDASSLEDEGATDGAAAPPPPADDGAAAPAISATPAIAGLPFGDEELERARTAIEAGDVERAAVHLAFVLRLTPALAPIVVELVGARHEPALAFVRGDAYRLVGREAEALEAFADAARPPADTPTDSESPTEPATQSGPASPPDHDRPEGDPA